jgi:uncharacterized membrane protein
VEPAQEPSTAPSTPLQATEVLPSSSRDITENKDLAALSYVWILSVVVYATRRDSPFIRYHAKQGMALFFLSVGVWFVPFVAKPLELIVLALAVLGFKAAAQGQWKDVPLIGPLSRGEWNSVMQSVHVFMTDLRRATSFISAHLGRKSVKNASRVAATPTLSAPASQTPSASIPSQP